MPTPPSLSKNHGLFKTSSLLFIALIIANLFNYLFQLTMGRLLSVKTFGELNAFSAIFMILTIPFMSSTNYLAKNIAHNCTTDEIQKTKALIASSLKIHLLIALLIIIYGVTLSHYMANYLKIEQILPVILLFVSISTYIIIPLNTGILQGFQMFGMLAFISSAPFLFKYVFCVLAVIVDTGLSGIMVGLTLSSIITGCITFIPIKKTLNKATYPPNTTNTTKTTHTTDKTYIIYIIATNLAFAIITQSDIVIAKYYFTPQEAGIFSSASVIAKIVMNLPAAIVLALFPMVASGKSKNESTLPYLIEALVITILLSGGCTLVFYLFPDILVFVFFGKKFITASPLIGTYSLSMLPVALTMIIINYNMARGDKTFVFVIVFFAIVELIGFVLYHNSVQSLIKVILFSSIFCNVALFTLLALQYYLYGKTKKD